MEFYLRDDKIYGLDATGLYVCIEEAPVLLTGLFYFLDCERVRATFHDS